jgi:cytochrome c oxidase assembly protein subunit 11
VSARIASRANRRLGLTMAGVAVAMLGLAFAAVPLYRIFCQVTGYGGTTQRALAAPDHVGERMMTVRFNAEIGGNNLPWTFEPIQREVRLKVGEERLAYYRAHNNATVAVTGMATFNVTPQKAGLYFEKISCFCFTAQTLAPGETAEMPVSFFIDPDIVKDPNLDDVTTITLSYTFFRTKSDGDGPSRVDGARTLSSVPEPAPAVN